MTVAEQIRSNLTRVREQIDAAARRSGRTEDEVQLVAVTKYASSAITRHLVEAGCRDLGESRPQQLWQKREDLGEFDVRWHMIGHLQRNKLRRTLDQLHLLHSVDSDRLLNGVNDWCQAAGESLAILIEVNVSGDPEKHGFLPDSVEEAVRKTMDMEFVQLRGLMCMASRSGGEETARTNFRALRQLRDQLGADIVNCPDLSELSMGMSRDFPIAIEEGATLVRVGSTLFEGINVES